MTTSTLTTAIPILMADGTDISIFIFGTGGGTYTASPILSALGASSINIKLFPASGTEGWKCWVLPALASSLSFVATMTRMTRSSMLDVVRQDYITTARTKGVNEGTVIRKHALRNALIPIITTIGFQFGILIAGSVIVETIFNMNGMGSLMMTAINNKAYPVIEGCVLVLSF